MNKILLLTILSLTLYTNSWADDVEIAENLLNFYMSDNLQLDDIEKVMEFDSDNSIALIEKVKLIRNKTSLYTIRDLLEKSNLITEYSKVMYIDTLYKLKDYGGIKQYYNDNIFSTDLPVSFYYKVINSLIFLEEYDRAVDLFTLYHNYFRKTTEFLELEFLLFQNRNVLDELYNQSEFTVLIRLYNRVEMDELFELYIYRFVNTLHEKIVINYKILDLLISKFSYKYDGIILLDVNSDSIVDTELLFKNNVLFSKKIDLDQDYIDDYRLLLRDGFPLSVKYNNKEIIFSNYPYIDSVIVEENDITKYKLSENRYPYKLINPITHYPDLSIFSHNINKLSLDWIEEYNKGVLKKRYYYINDRDYLIFEDYRDNNYFKVSHYIDGMLYRSLTDLDYDMIFDFYELFNSDELILSAYSENGDPQRIDKLEIFSESNSKYIKEISFNWNTYTEK